MDIERLNSEEFKSELREIIRQKEKKRHRFPKYDYSVLYNKIDQFIENITNSSSYFGLFRFSDLPEDDVIRLAEIFVCRPNHLRDIYTEMSYTCSWDYDFKGLIYSNTDLKISDEIYADYKSVVNNFKSLEKCVLLNSNEKYVIWQARTIYQAILDLTKEFNLGDIKEYSTALSCIYRFINLFYYSIRTYESNNSNENKYGFCQALTIELFMDLVETIVRVSLMYYVPFFVRFCSEQSRELTLEDAYKRVLKRTETINENLAVLFSNIIEFRADGIKTIKYVKLDQNHISFDVQLKRFVYFLERCTKYQNSSFTMDSLQMMKYDYNSIIDKAAKKYTRKKFTLSKLSKYTYTEGKRKDSHHDQMHKISLLLKAASDYNNNDLLYCQKKKILYKELFVKKQKSPVLNVSATKLLNDLYITDFDKDKYQWSFNDCPYRETDYDQFVSKRHYRQSLDYLDQAFVRGFFYENDMVDEYRYYVGITNNIYKSLLSIYLFYDYDLIFLLLKNIAGMYVDVLSFEANSNEPQPILWVEKERKNGKIEYDKISFIKHEKRIYEEIIKKPRGRTRKITQDDDKKIEELIASDNRITIKEIIDHLSLEVTEECVRQHIKSLGYEYDRKTGYAKKSVE